MIDVVGAGIAAVDRHRAAVQGCAGLGGDGDAVWRGRNLPSAGRRPDVFAFWAAVSRFDWVALWRAVNETLPDSAAPMADRLTEVKSLIELPSGNTIQDCGSSVTMIARRTHPALLSG
jgi:hypothetical protein